MANQKRNDWFSELVKGFNQKSQELLRLEAVHRQMIERFNQSKEREKLKQEIKAELIRDIEITVDAEEVIQKIEKLEKAIDELFKHFK